MPALIYIVEGVKAPVTRAQLVAWGLAHAFDGVPYHADTAALGGGVLLADAARLEPYQPLYKPELQTWIAAKRKFAPGPAWRVGYYREAKPGAADLLRGQPVRGSEVELADGGRWQVPLVRCLFADGELGTPLPSYLAMDDDGAPIAGEVVDEYAWLLEQVTPFWDAWQAGLEACDPAAGNFTFTVPDSIYGDAAAVLGANYRLGPVEAELLKLFRSDGSLGAVLRAACDCDYAVAVLQKKRALASGD